MAEKTMHQPSTVRLPDASLLITLAYADALDLLFKPDWTVEVVDMVLFEVTRHHTPTSDKLASWLESHQLTIRPTDIHQRYLQALSSSTPPSKAGLGELAIQEAMNSFALQATPSIGVFLFENHKIARASFILPANCRKVSTRAYLLFLEQKGWITSAIDIERKAILAGRAFSTLRFA